VGVPVPAPEGGPGTRWVRSPRVLWRRTTTEVVLLAPDGAGDVVALAGTGAELWEVLALPHRLDEMAAELGRRHGADPSVVATDVAPVIHHLAGLAVVVAAGGAP
jgi:hypothetical protein